MLDPFIGEIALFAGDYAPQGWALCNGQILNVQSNPPLFALLGTRYGGDGVRTFALPDLRGRAPIHFGTGEGLSEYALGQRAGAEKVALTTNEIPAHGHPLMVSPEYADANDPQNAFLAQTVDANFDPQTPIYHKSAVPTAQMDPRSIGQTGGGQPHSVMQPVIAMCYIIALQGNWPSRD